MNGSISIYEMAGLAAAAAALALAGVAFWKILKLQRFQKKFFAGREAADLEHLILTHDDRLDELADKLKSALIMQKHLQQLQQLAVQKVGVVRFNAFASAGGNNSFSIALLDGADNGIVISSLHGRDSQRVYAKAIKNGESAVPLTGEEKQAILESRKIVPATKIK